MNKDIINSIPKSKSSIIYRVMDFAVEYDAKDVIFYPGEVAQAFYTYSEARVENSNEYSDMFQIKLDISITEFYSDGFNKDPIVKAFIESLSEDELINIGFFVKRKYGDRYKIDYLYFKKTVGGFELTSVSDPSTDSDIINTNSFEAKTYAFRQYVGSFIRFLDEEDFVAITFLGEFPKISPFKKEILAAKRLIDINYFNFYPFFSLLGNQKYIKFLENNPTLFKTILNSPDPTPLHSFENNSAQKFYATANQNDEPIKLLGVFACAITVDSKSYLLDPSEFNSFIDNPILKKLYGAALRSLISTSNFRIVNVDLDALNLSFESGVDIFKFVATEYQKTFDEYIFGVHSYWNKIKTRCSNISEFALTTLAAKFANKYFHININRHLDQTLAVERIFADITGENFSSFFEVNSPEKKETQLKNTSMEVKVLEVHSNRIQSKDIFYRGGLHQNNIYFVIVDSKPTQIIYRKVKHAFKNMSLPYGNKIYILQPTNRLELLKLKTILKDHQRTFYTSEIDKEVALPKTVQQSNRQAKISKLKFYYQAPGKEIYTWSTDQNPEAMRETLQNIILVPYKKTKSSVILFDQELSLLGINDSLAQIRRIIEVKFNKKLIFIQASNLATLKKSDYEFTLLDSFLKQGHLKNIFDQKDIEKDFLCVGDETIFKFNVNVLGNLTHIYQLGSYFLDTKIYYKIVNLLPDPIKNLLFYLESVLPSGMYIDRPEISRFLTNHKFLRVNQLKQSVFKEYFNHLQVNTSFENNIDYMIKNEESLTFDLVPLLTSFFLERVNYVVEEAYQRQTLEYLSKENGVHLYGPPHFKVATNFTVYKICSNTQFLDIKQNLYYHENPALLLKDISTRTREKIYYLDRKFILNLEDALLKINIRS